MLRSLPVHKASRARRTITSVVHRRPVAIRWPKRQGCAFKAGLEDWVA